MFPAQGFAQVLFEQGRKRLEISARENRLGADGVSTVSAWYFIGEPKQIYKDYKAVCEQEGYPGFRPKYRFFELGYEAFGRSEEHTSELQSLMRISYAVLCLKKKNTQTKINHKHTQRHPASHDSTT